MAAPYGYQVLLVNASGEKHIHGGSPDLQAAKDMAKAAVAAGPHLRAEVHDLDPGAVGYRAIKPVQTGEGIAGHLHAVVHVETK